MNIFAALFLHLLTFFTLTMLIPTSAGAAGHGVWTRWDEWSPCDVTCGSGHKTRYRACFPIGAHCNGSAVETAPCKMQDCPGVGRWSKWTDWTECTRSCGVGMQTQFRKCLSDQCTGSNRHVRLCNTKPCPVSGGWSAWNEWSACSEPCGIGIRYQDRTCEDPAPVAGGLTCKGIGTRIGHCFEKPCSDNSIQAGVFYGDSYLEYDKTYFPKKLLSLFIKFKPYERDGLILYRHHGSNDTTTRRNDTVILRLDGARLAVFAQYGDVESWIQSADVLEIKQWHSVFLTIAGGRLVLRIDNGIPVEKMFGNIQMEKVDLDQQMFVGALSETFSASTGIVFPGFVGHVSAIRVNYEEYFMDDVEELSVNQETNHPIYRYSVDMTEMDSLDLYPTFGGSEYTVFTCLNCRGQPDFQVEVIIKPFDTSSGVIWSSFGQQPGSYVILYLYQSTLILTVNLGAGKAWTTTEPIAVGAWLTISVVVLSKQVKLRLNHERAYLLALEGDAFNASRPVHFGGGEVNYWTLLYLATEQVKGFRGILYSMNINKKEHNVLREVVTRETGRMVSSESSSIAARYEEFHEPPISEVEFQCDLSAHEEKLGVSGGIVFWLRESEIIQNFTGITVQKVPGMKHATKMILRNREVGEKDGFYGCLLRTAHQEILVHVFGVSFDDANDIDYVDVGESAALVAALLGSLFALGALAVILRSGLMRRFPPYNALLRRLPSWMSPEDRKNLLLRHTDSLRRAGELPEDYLKDLLNMQEKAVQVPSLTTLPTRQPPLHDLDYRPYSSYDDPDSDYDAPVPAKKSDGTLFPQPLILSRPRGPVNQMPIPPHIKKDPQKYLPKFYDTDKSDREHLTQTTSYDTSTTQNTSSKKPRSKNTTKESEDDTSEEDEDSFQLRTISSTDKKARRTAEVATYKRPRPKTARHVTPERGKVKFNRKPRSEEEDDQVEVQHRGKQKAPTESKRARKPQRSYETFPFQNASPYRSPYRTPQPTQRRDSANAIRSPRQYVGGQYGQTGGLSTPTGRVYVPRAEQWVGPSPQYGAPTSVQPQQYTTPTQPVDAYGAPVGPGYAMQRPVVPPNNLAYHQEWPPQQEEVYGVPGQEYEQADWTGQGADEQGLLYDEAGNAYYPPPQEFAGYDAQGNQLFYQ